MKTFRNWTTVAALLVAFCPTLLPAMNKDAGRDLKLPERGIGGGLDGVSYYSTYPAYTDALKQARWIQVASWNERGFPTSAQPGETATARVAVEAGESWPSGEYTLLWWGDGDISMNSPGATLLSEDLTTEPKRRVYQVAPSRYGLEVSVDRYPIDDARLLLPGLAEHPSIWNPAYLAHIKPFANGPIRFMDLGGTNNSNQRTWSDRTPRNWSNYVNKNHGSSAPWRVLGVTPWEVMMELCNELNADMWVCIPHMADDDYISNLAHLIRTGTDRATGEKTTEPLKPGLRVWIEYSNEVWNWNFAQSKWVDNNIPVEGNLDVKYAHRANQIFDIFESEFEGVDRLVRIIGTQTGYGNGTRTRNRLGYLERSDYDVLAITTYFEHGIKQWLYDNWGVSVEDALNEIIRRVGTGPFGPNEKEDENKKDFGEYRAAREFQVPVVAYEGNDHINPVGRIDTNGDDKFDSRLDQEIPEVVDFIHAMARHPLIKIAYGNYLARHHASGLHLHMPFVLIGGWSRFGQWGHMEYLGQPLEEAPKYQLMLEFYHLPHPAR